MTYDSIAKVDETTTLINLELVAFTLRQMVNSSKGKKKQDRFQNVALS